MVMGASGKRTKYCEIKKGEKLNIFIKVEVRAA